MDLAAMTDRLVAAMRGLNAAEREIVLRRMEGTAARLKLGRERYGAFDPTTDARRWDAEIAEELDDAAVYLEMGRLVEEARR